MNNSKEFEEQVACPLCGLALIVLVLAFSIEILIVLENLNVV